MSNLEDCREGSSHRSWPPTVGLQSVLSHPQPGCSGSSPPHPPPTAPTWYRAADQTPFGVVTYTVPHALSHWRAGSPAGRILSVSEDVLTFKFAFTSVNSFFTFSKILQY